MRNVLPYLREDCLILVEISIEALADHGMTFDDVADFFGLHGWQPFEIVNSYRPEFYCRPPDHTLTIEIRKDARFINLGFAQPALRDALLRGDGARQTCVPFRKQIGV